MQRPKDSRPVPITALSISHTCGHFRAVAIGCQQLWRLIDFQRNRMTVNCARLFAYRARMALSIIIYSRSSLRERKFLLDNIHIVSEIYVLSGASIQELRTSQFQISFRTVTAPMLKVLSTRAHGDTIYAFESAPCLSILDIKVWENPWVIARYRCLKSLTLCGDCTQSQPLAILMGILRSSPDLEVLSLTFGPQTLISTSGTMLPSVLCALKKLKRLSLHLSHADIYHIIRSLATPPNMHMGINIVCNENEPILPFLPTEPRCLPCLGSLHALSCTPGSVLGWRDKDQPSVSIVNYKIYPAHIFKEICTSRWAHSISKVYIGLSLSHDFVPILWGLHNLHTLILGKLKHSDYDIIIRGAIDHFYPVALCPSLKAIGFDGALIKPSTLVKLLTLFPKISRPVRFTNSSLYLTSQDAPTSALECLCKLGYTGDIVGVLESTDTNIPSTYFIFRNGYWGKAPASRYSKLKSGPKAYNEYFNI